MKNIPTPLKSIRAYCLWCCDKQVGEVKNCAKIDCHFYTYRMGKKMGKGSLIKIIRKRCFECSEGTSQSVTKCEFPDCHLFAYKDGKSPAHILSWANREKRPNPFKNHRLATKETADTALKTSKSDSQN
ncbi:MAG: hypothetical protein PF572_04185 [Patescibacteria group bacterium]|jgi:hypothetical protein|nr:hypothetical protein [Patescibacteria group bacterium]